MKRHDDDSSDLTCILEGPIERKSAPPMVITIEDLPKPPSVIKDYILDEAELPEIETTKDAQALRIHSDVASTWREKAKTYYRLRDYRSALMSINEVLERELTLEDLLEKCRILINIGQRETTNGKKAITEAISILKQVSQGSGSAGVYHKLGNAFIAIGDYENALESYNKALREKEDAWVLTDKGICLFHLGRHEEEIACYDRALEIKPTFGRALINKGISLADKFGNHREAVNSYLRGIALDPALGSIWKEVWYALSYSYIHLKKEEDAMKAIDRALSIDSEFIQAVKVKCFLLAEAWRSERKLLKEVASFFERYIKELYQNANFSAEFGFISFFLQNLEVAKYCFERAIKQGKKDGEVFGYYADVLSRLGQTKRAIFYFDRAVRLGCEKYNYFLGREYLRDGDLDRAEHHLLIAHDTYPDDPKILNDLGVCYELEDKLNLSLWAFRETLRIDPQYALANCNLGCVYSKLDESGLANRYISRSLEKEIEIPQVRRQIRRRRNKFYKLDETRAYLRKELKEKSEVARVVGEKKLAKTMEEFDRLQQRAREIKRKTKQMQKRDEISKLL